MMIPAHRFAMATLILTLFGLAWLSSPMRAQATTITDTLVLTGSDKTWCRGNPKFFETFTVKAKDGVTLTVTQDPLNTGDVATLHATINTHGGSADTDAITLKGLAFPSNKSHSIAQIILSDTNPSNPDHFLAIRGQATFDKTGHLTRMTGMVWTTVLIHTRLTNTGPRVGRSSVSTASHP